MKIALVYDQVNKFGGAERLLLALRKIYPEAPLFTLVYHPQSAPWSKKFSVTASPLNKIKFLQTRHQWLPPIAPMMFETFNFDRFNLVISITSNSAKAIITKPETLHICYCLTPTRHFWGDIKEYRRNIKMRITPKLIKKYLQTVDLLISKRPDQYIAISREVKNRIATYYNQDSSVIYPPIENKFYSNKPPVSFTNRQHYLIVSRLEPYKKIDLVIKSFNRLRGRTLQVVGGGSQLKRLKRLAGNNIIFWGQVSDRELIKLYREAKAVIFPQIEDFGLVSLEAQISGTPVIAFDQGGAKETVIGNQTGIFFKTQTVSGLIEAIERFESGKHQITPEKCIQNAAKFSSNRFTGQFRDKVNELWQQQQKNLNT